MDACASTTAAELREQDETFVAAAQAGDVRAFEALYRRHASRLMPMLWRLAGGDRALAEDWLQDVFVRAWQKMDQVRDRAAFGGWIRRLAANVALSDRRRGRLNTVDVDIDSPAPVSVALTQFGKKCQRIDRNQKLINLAAAKLGAAVTGGFAGTVEHFDWGARTPAAGACTVVGLAIAAFVLTPLTYYLL